MGEIRKNIAALQAREGSECILYSQGLIIHGYLKDVLTDSWGIRCSLDPIPTAGLLQPKVRTGVSVNWNDFGESDRDWSSSAQGATWFVFFGEDLIQAIIACASQSPAETEPNDRRSKLINVLVDYNWGLGFDG
jgi:hypothetical protein